MVDIVRTISSLRLHSEIFSEKIPRRYGVRAKVCGKLQEYCNPCCRSRRQSRAAALLEDLVSRPSATECWIHLYCRTIRLTPTNRICLVGFCFFFAFFCFPCFSFCFFRGINIYERSSSKFIRLHIVEDGKHKNKTVKREKP